MLTLNCNYRKLLCIVTTCFKLMGFYTNILLTIIVIKREKANDLHYFFNQFCSK